MGPPPKGCSSAAEARSAEASAWHHTGARGGSAHTAGGGGDRGDARGVHQSRACLAEAGARQHARAGGGAADTTTERPRLGGRDRAEAAEGEGQEERG